MAGDEKKEIIYEWTGDVATTRPEAAEILRKHGLHMGRMISYSKSYYTRLYPDHKVFFNGNIFDSRGRKIWWGDIDVTAEAEKLLAAAEELGEPLIVAHEVARWHGENLNKDFVKGILEDGSYAGLCRGGVYGRASTRWGTLIVVVLPEDCGGEEEAVEKARRVLESLLSTQ